MRAPEPPLPSISYVLTQAAARPRSKRPSAPLRRYRSSPSFAPHPPRYPPQLERDYLLTTVDYRFSHSPRRPSSRSSVALSTELLEDEENYEIVDEPPSPTDTLAPSSSSSATHSATSTTTTTSTSTSTSPSTHSRRKLSTYLHDALHAVRYRCQRVRRMEESLRFDLCT